MFDNQRYLTRGVNETIPFEIQAFMWDCIDRLPEDERDYFQIFELEDIGGMQHIVHKAEQPEYCMNYFMPWKSLKKETILTSISISKMTEVCTMGLRLSPIPCRFNTILKTSAGRMYFIKLYSLDTGVIRPQHADSMYM